MLSFALDFASLCGETAMKFEKRSPMTSIDWDHFASLASEWEYSVIDNIDEEYNRLVEHLHDSARKAESPQVAKRQLFSKTLELIKSSSSLSALDTIHGNL
ncbi:hypothetical protein V3C99_005412 [Haemonchus contortus]|uniref:CdiI_2 domain-containing protein n=1 Tax=Haemonchus contortus TaxID=6289 RepID=A0A7I4XX89_HAECO